MMRASSLLALVVISMGVATTWAQDRGAPSGEINSPTEPQGTTRDYVSQSDVKDLADLVDTKRMLEGKHVVPVPVAKQRSLAMLAALHVACKLTDAKSIGGGTRMVDGKAMEMGLYEVSCGDGMGYLLTMEGRSMASGISCFEAGAASAADSTRPGGTDLRCLLAQNANLNAMATVVMRDSGTACAARDVRWLGHSAAPDFDYTDVACADGNEFVLHTPAPGSQGSAGVLTCREAAKQGAGCQLVHGGAGPSVAAQSAATDQAAQGAQAHPDLKWFENALTQNGVACDVKNARLLGRESIKKRWVVEFQCAQDPRGVVAYVPSAGDTVHPFERIDCDAAATRHLTCAFPHAK